MALEQIAQSAHQYPATFARFYTGPAPQPYQPLAMGGGMAGPMRPPEPLWKGSLGKSQGEVNYIKTFPNGDKLSVHAPNGMVTGAKYNDEHINNYQAAMHDLRDGIVKKNTGGTW